MFLNKHKVSTESRTYSCLSLVSLLNISVNCPLSLLWPRFLQHPQIFFRKGSDILEDFGSNTGTSSTYRVSRSDICDTEYGTVFVKPLLERSLHIKAMRLVLTMTWIKWNSDDSIQYLIFYKNVCPRTYMCFALGGSWYGISPLSLLLLKSLYYDEQMHSIQVMCFKKKTKWKIKRPILMNWALQGGDRW